MSETRISLVTGANQGVGFQVAKELVASGITVYVGSRNLERGEAAAAEIGSGAIALQIDVTDGASIADAAERIRSEHGRLDLLVNNAGISNTHHGPMGRLSRVPAPTAAHARLVRPVHVVISQRDGAYQRSR
jgi:NAD(P)-dependent dehydrogenase (short-subunit alcohol dehydrogenase family)